MNKKPNKKCIYCGEDKPKTKEHVLMQSFGKFGSETPVLDDCVCGSCNQFFKTNLDEIFSRNSLEGITRYNKGIKSRESRIQKKQYLEISIPKEKEFGEWGGVLVWIDGKTSQIKSVLPQVHFKKQSGEYTIFLKDELDNLNWKESGLLDKELKIYAPSETIHNELIEKLKKIGINYKEKKSFGADFIKRYVDQKMPINISCTVDHVMKRALVKMIFNFAAKYIDYSEVMKVEWDKTRNYIRFNKEPIKARALNEPFWGEESKELRFPDNGYNIRIENYGNNVVGAIQFYNLYLYEFILVENYNILESQQLAVRFIPGERPFFGKKLEAIEIGNIKIPILK